MNLKFVATFTADAELSILFLDMQEAKMTKLILQKLGDPQPSTPIHVDNTIAVGINNSTIKPLSLKAIEMSFTSQ